MPWHTRINVIIVLKGEQVNFHVNTSHIHSRQGTTDFTGHPKKGAFHVGNNSGEFSFVADISLGKFQYMTVCVCAC